MAGTVYFIRSLTPPRIKIGFTAADPGLRFRRLRAINSGSVEPIALMSGPKLLETEIHTRFASIWDHGEWFEATPELEAFIAEAATPWAGKPLAFRRKLPVVKPPKVARPEPRPVALPPELEPAPRTPSVREIRDEQRRLRKQRARYEESGVEPSGDFLVLAAHYGVPVRSEDEPPKPLPANGRRTIVEFEEIEPRGVIEVLECGHHGKRHRGFASAQYYSPRRRLCRECLAAASHVA
jgi:hypothetical protein